MKSFHKLFLIVVFQKVLEGVRAFAAKFKAPTIDNQDSAARTFTTRVSTTGVDSPGITDSGAVPGMCYYWVDSQVLKIGWTTQ